MRRTYDLSTEEYTVRGSGIAMGGYYHPEDYGDGGPAIEGREAAELERDAAREGVETARIGALIAVMTLASTAIGGIAWFLARTRRR